MDEGTPSEEETNKEEDQCSEFLLVSLIQLFDTEITFNLVFPPPRPRCSTCEAESTPPRATTSPSPIPLSETQHETERDKS